MSSANILTKQRFFGKRKLKVPLRATSLSLNLYPGFTGCLGVQVKLVPEKMESEKQWLCWLQEAFGWAQHILLYTSWGTLCTHGIVSCAVWIVQNEPFHMVLFVLKPCSLCFHRRGQKENTLLSENWSVWLFWARISIGIVNTINVKEEGVFCLPEPEGWKENQTKTSIVFFACFRNLQGETSDPPMGQIHESFCSSDPKIIFSYFFDCELGRMNFSKLS